ncbi:hypothetical protein [Methylobacterium durans]|uniref:hypothetical protein n=1 Tax=Methylobacterium durans TaxID=2202825 RepID=UPI0013A5485F|nr:hypothetical protein [Methylobacterium durans]
MTWDCDHQGERFVYEEGGVFPRSLVHERFGTHPGKGIWVNNSSKTIVAYDTVTRLECGYENRRDGDIFLYYGMGPKGNMDINARENQSIIKSRQSGHELVMFSEINRGEMMFVGKFVCLFYRHGVKALDIVANERDAIVFEFTPQFGIEKFRDLCPPRSCSDPAKRGGWKRIATPL